MPVLTNATLRSAISDPTSVKPNLRDLIRQQAGDTTSLRALIAHDAQDMQRRTQRQIPSRPIPALPAGPAPLTIHYTAQKEITHVVARDQA